MAPARSVPALRALWIWCLTTLAWKMNSLVTLQDLNKTLAKATTSRLSQTNRYSSLAMRSHGSDNNSGSSHSLNSGSSLDLFHNKPKYVRISVEILLVLTARSLLRPALKHACIKKRYVHGKDCSKNRREHVTSLVDLRGQLKLDNSFIIVWSSSRLSLTIEIRRLHVLD